MNRALKLLPLMLLALGHPLHADEASPYLTGDWGGTRSRLADEGIALNFGYTSEDLANIRGGDRHSLVHTGQLTLGTVLDLQKLWGLKGASFHFTTTYRDGHNIEDNGVDTLLQPQEVYGRGQTWRLTEMYWGQWLFHDHLQVKLGRLTVGGEFGDVECTFVNQGLCGSEPGNIRGDYWYNWPTSQWAAVGQIQFNPDHYLKLAVYQVNPAFVDRDNKFTLNPPGTIGALFPVEFGWMPKLGDNLPGAYKFGAWYTNAHTKDVYDDKNGDPAALTDLGYQMRDSAYGAYFSIEQQLSHGRGDAPKSGWRIFINATASDRQTSTVYQTLGIGSIDKGLLPDRPDDEFGFGVSALRVNPRAVADESLLYQLGERGRPADHDEYLAELFYGLQVTRWLRFQPEVQWIHHPGLVARNQGSYTIVGAKTAITF
ncbi:carbohydrate porin [Frateuria aurantia]